jgi:hypothetical protein
MGATRVRGDKIAFAPLTQSLLHKNSSQAESEREIYRSRAELAARYADLIQGLDETNQWVLIVTKALEAGLRKRELCRELSCSWSTILRWKAGDTAPGPFARRKIKETLLRLIEELKRTESKRAAEVV